MVYYSGMANKAVGSPSGNTSTLTDAEKSDALGCLLYDMWVLAASAHYLKHWKQPTRDADLGYEWVASTAAQVKIRSIHDFFNKAAQAHKGDITVALLGGASPDKVWSDKKDQVLAVNKWCAHLTIDRIDKLKKKQSMPLRSDVLKSARRILRAADEYVAERIRTSIKLRPAGKKYRAKVQNLLATL